MSSVSELLTACVLIVLLLLIQTTHLHYSIRIDCYRSWNFCSELWLHKSDPDTIAFSSWLPWAYLRDSFTGSNPQINVLLLPKLKTVEKSDQIQHKLSNGKPLKFFPASSMMTCII